MERSGLDTILTNTKYCKWISKLIKVDGIRKATNIKICNIKDTYGGERTLDEQKEMLGNN